MAFQGFQCVLYFYWSVCIFVDIFRYLLIFDKVHCAPRQTQFCHRVARCFRATFAWCRRATQASPSPRFRHTDACQSRGARDHHVLNIYIYIYTYIHILYIHLVYIYIYIYIYSNSYFIYIYIYIYTHNKHIYIYICASYAHIDALASSKLFDLIWTNQTIATNIKKCK